MSKFYGPVAALCLSFGAGLSVPAVAQSDLVVAYQPAMGTITRTRAVETADLALNTTDGRATLDRRIFVAARQVCGYEGRLGLRQPTDYKRCFIKARGDAMSEAPAIRTASLD